MKTSVLFAALLLMVVAGCGGGDGGKEDPGSDTVMGQDTQLDSTVGQDSEGDQVPGEDLAVPDSVEPDVSQPLSEVDALYRTCSFVAACLNDARIGLFANKCFEDLLSSVTLAADPRKEYGRLMECAATSSTCAEFVACDRLGVTYQCQSPTDSSCVGDAFVDCEASNQIARVFDCAVGEGMACVPGVGCATETTCPTGKGSATCEGAELVVCPEVYSGQTGYQTRYTCPEGTVCLEAFGAGSCSINTTQDDSCTAGRTCEGTVLKSCGMGLLYSLDCAKWDRVCGTDPTANCVPASDECEAPSSVPSETAYADNCADAVLKTCMNGRIKEIDCAVLGSQGLCELVDTLGGAKRGVCR